MSHEALGRQFGPAAPKGQPVYGIVVHRSDGTKSALEAEPGMTTDNPKHMKAVQHFVSQGHDVTAHPDRESLVRAVKGNQVEPGTSRALASLVGQTAKSFMWNKGNGSPKIWVPDNLPG